MNISIWSDNMWRAKFTKSSELITQLNEWQRLRIIITHGETILAESDDTNNVCVMAIVSDGDKFFHLLNGSVCSFIIFYHIFFYLIWYRMFVTTTQSKNQVLEMRFFFSSFHCYILTQPNSFDWADVIAPRYISIVTYIYDLSCFLFIILVHICVLFFVPFTPIYVYSWCYCCSLVPRIAINFQNNSLLRWK